MYKRNDLGNKRKETWKSKMEAGNEPTVLFLMVNYFLQGFHVSFEGCGCVM